MAERLLHEAVVRRRVRAPLLQLLLDRHLLLAHGAPELDRLQRNRLLVLLGGLRGQVEDGGYVRRELVVVVLGDADQHFVRRLPHAHVGARRALARHLHDVVALMLPLEVLLGEVHRVRQRHRRGEPHLDIRLLLAHAGEDGGEHGVHLPLAQVIRVDLLADVPQRLERRLAQARGRARVRHVRLQPGHQVGPLLGGDLGAGDLSHRLRAGVADFRGGGAQRVPHLRLDGGSRPGVEGEPFLLQVGFSRLVARVERVFQDQARQPPHFRRFLLVGQLAGEPGEETREVGLLRVLELLLRGLARARVGALRRGEDGGDVGHRAIGRSFHASVTSEPCAKQRRERGSRSRGAGRGTRAERDTAVGSRAPTAARSGMQPPVRIVVAMRQSGGRTTRDLPASRNAMPSFPGSRLRHDQKSRLQSDVRSPSIWDRFFAFVSCAHVFGRAPLRRRARAAL